jgi:hypothetical protein
MSTRKRLAGKAPSLPAPRAAWAARLSERLAGKEHLWACWPGISMALPLQRGRSRRQEAKQ